MKRLFSCLLVTMVLMSVGTGSQARDQDRLYQPAGVDRGYARIQKGQQ